MSEKIILDLCGGTGSWSKPYKEAGYDVRNITLPKYDILNYKPPKNVYGILAAPPCTMFSFARQTAKTPRDFTGALKIVKKCLDIIWQCRLDGKLKFWALENPKGYLRQFLGKPYLEFSPEQYGENYTKPTDIWGYFFKPKKNKYEGELIGNGKNWKWVKNKILPDDYIFPENWTANQAKKSMTSSKFAIAFFKANK